METRLLLLAFILAEIIHGAVLVFLIHKNHDQNKELFNRFMAGDYQSYRYHKDVAPAEIKLFEEKAKGARERERNKSDADRERESVAADF